MRQSTYREGPILIGMRDLSYAFPFGVAYLIGYLRERGEDPRLLFWPEAETVRRKFVADILAAKPLLLGLGGLYPDLYPVREIIAELDAQGRDFPIVLGGQMVSPIPEFALKVTGADYGVIGEGEIILHEFVQALREGRDPSSLPGVATRDGEAVSVNGPGPFIEDLSVLPAIPYDLFPVEKWLHVGRFYANRPQPHWHFRDRVVSIHGGRGCPYQCNFCYHHSRPRYRPIPDMFAEIRESVERFKANVVYFGDDLVLATRDRAQQLVAEMDRLPGKLEYSVSSRFDILSRMPDDLLREMKRTGCRIMGLGIESGSQRMLDVMHKKITVEQIRDGLARLKEVGIFPTVSIMVGQWGETEEDVRKSKEIMLESIQRDKNIGYVFTITTPFPGSELYDMAKQKGLIRDDMDFYEKFDPGYQFMSLSANLSAMSDETLVAKRLDLEQTFKRERDRMVGPWVDRIQKLRSFLANKNLSFFQDIITEIPGRPVRLLVNAIYSGCYNLVQSLLDDLRMWLLHRDNRK